MLLVILSQLNDILIFLVSTLNSSYDLNRLKRALKLYGAGQSGFMWNNQGGARKYNVMRGEVKTFKVNAGLSPAPPIFHP